MPELRLDYDAWHEKKSRSRVETSEQIANNNILDTLGTKKGESLLDLGCGKGNFCNSAFKRGLDVYGVDFSSVALKEARVFNQKINFVLSDASLLPFKDSFFDYVVCLGSLEHFPDKVAALHQIHRVLKGGGRAYMFLPNSYFLGHIYMVFKTGLPPDEAGQEFSEDFNTKFGWKKLLEENSFRVISIQKFNTIWASEKVSQITKYIYNFIVKPFIPFNLSYAFGYLCAKN